MEPWTRGTKRGLDIQNRSSRLGDTWTDRFRFLRSSEPSVTPGRDGGLVGSLPSWLKLVHLRTTFAQGSQRAYPGLSTRAVCLATAQDRRILATRLDVSPSYSEPLSSSHGQTNHHRPLFYRAVLLTGTIPTTFSVDAPDLGSSVSDPRCSEATGDRRSRSGPNTELVGSLRSGF